MDKRRVEDKIEKEEILDIDTEVSDTDTYTAPPTEELKVEEGKIEDINSSESDSDSPETQIMDSVEEEITKKESTVDVDKKIKFDERKLNKDIISINNMEKTLHDRYRRKKESEDEDSITPYYQDTSSADARRLRQKKIDFDLFRSKNELAILNELRQINNYNETNATNYYRKSLELQYKSFYIHKDFLQLFKVYQIDTRNQLASIIKNSSLGNSLKLSDDGLEGKEQNFSFLKDMIQLQILKKYGNVFGESFKNSDFFKRTKQSLMDTVRNSSLYQNDTVRGIIDSYQASQLSVDNIRSGDSQDVVGNLKFEDTVIKVIPGYLSKILQQVTNIYNKSDHADELEYNYEKDTFLNKSEMMDFVDSKFKTGINANMYKIDRQLETIVDMVDKDKSISSNDKENIKNAILKQIINNKDLNSLDALKESLTGNEFNKDFIYKVYNPFVSKITEITNSKDFSKLKKHLDNLKVNTDIDKSTISDLMKSLSGSEYLKNNNITYYDPYRGLTLNQDGINSYMYGYYSSRTNQPYDVYTEPVQEASIVDMVDEKVNKKLIEFKEKMEEANSSDVPLIEYKQKPKYSVEDIIRRQEERKRGEQVSEDKTNIDTPKANRFGSIFNILGKSNIISGSLGKLKNITNPLNNITSKVKSSISAGKNYAGIIPNFIGKFKDKFSSTKDATKSKLSDFKERVNDNIPFKQFFNKRATTDEADNEEIENSVVNTIPGYLSNILSKITNITKILTSTEKKENNNQTNISSNKDTVVKSKTNKNKTKDINTTLLEEIRDTLKKAFTPKAEPRSGNWKDRLAGFNKKDTSPSPAAGKDKNDKSKESSSFDLLGMLGGLLGKGSWLGSTLMGMLGLAGGAAGIIGKVGSKALGTIGSLGKLGFNAAKSVAPLALGAGKTVLNAAKGATGFLGNVGVKTASTIGSAGSAIGSTAYKTANKGPIAMIKDKILSIANSLKSQIVKKLGKKAGGKVVATLTSKIAARAVPVAGAALLAYDAYNVYRDVQSGMELKSAISKNLIGFDIFGDDLPVDENGNPIKPDENLEENKTIKDEKTDIAKIGVYAKKAQDEYTRLKSNIDGYKSGIISKKNLPDPKVIKDRIEKEIKSLDTLKDWNKISDPEHQECMRIYDDCFKLIEELQLISKGSSLTKEQKKESLDKSKEDPNKKEVVKEKFDEYQKNKSSGGGLKSATEDIRGSNTSAVTTPDTNIGISVNTTSPVTSELSKIPTPTQASFTTSTPVNNVYGSKPTTKSSGSSKPSVKLSAKKQEVVNIIDEVGRKIGTDPEIMKAIAASESGFDPNAKAKTSTASGLFQIINATWKGMVNKYGKKYGVTNEDSHFDPVKNSILGGLYIKDNINVLSKVKPDVNATDAYMGHFLGAGGARKFLRNMNENPNQTLESTMPEIVSANKYIVYKNADTSKPRTLKEVYELMGSKIQKNARHYGFNVSDELVGLSGSGKGIASATPVNNVETTSATPPPITDANISKVEPKPSTTASATSDTSTSSASVSSGETSSPVSTSVTEVASSTPSSQKSTASVSASSKSSVMSASSDIGMKQPRVSYSSVKKPLEETIATAQRSNYTSSVSAPVESSRVETKYNFSSIQPKKSESMVKPSIDASILPSIDKTLIETLSVNKNMDSTLTKILEVNNVLVEEVKKIQVTSSTQANQPQPMYTQNTTSQPVFNVTSNSSTLPQPTMNIRRLTS